MKLTLDHYQPDTTFEDKWLFESDRLRYLEMEEKKKRGRNLYNRLTSRLKKKQPEKL